METIRLSIALYDYDHVRELTSGVVRPQGITLIPHQHRPHEMFYRFMTYHEWDIAEMSLGGFCASMAAGDDSMVAIPVFPSRVFRQSSFYIGTDGGIKTLEDLAGKRVGCPEWGMTAAIYARGWLVHQGGVALKDIRWVQAGMNEAGRTEKIGLNLPEGVEIEVVTDRCLSEMLLAGDLDALITAAPPAPFQKGDPRIQRLVPNHWEVEEAYFKETGIFPIMHVIAIRRELHDQWPWVAPSMYAAFEEAKRKSVERIFHHGSRIAHPWGYIDAARVGKMMFGEGEYWPYGIEPNRTTLEAFLQYCYEQGVCQRHLTPEELFVKEVQTMARE